MRKRNIVLSLGAAPAVAVLISSCAASQHVAHGNLTVQCTENRTGQDPTNGGVAGHGRCTITGIVHDSGPTTDYRTQNGETAIIRRVVTGAKGTITFVITIHLAGGPGGEPWKITSGTKTYAKLHGRGDQVVDNYQGDPATFVLKGTVSQARLKLTCPASCRGRAINPLCGQPSGLRQWLAGAAQPQRSRPPAGQCSRPASPARRRPEPVSGPRG